MNEYEPLDQYHRHPPNDYQRMRSPVTDPYRERRGGRRDGRDGRNRSRSPMHIDRYEPGRDRDRHDDHRGRDGDDRRRRTPPASQPGIDRYVPKHETASLVVANPILDPMKLGVQAGFTYFAEWWRHEKMVKDNLEAQKTGGRRPPRLRGEKESAEERAKERELIQADYDEYKKRLQAEMARKFVEEHKSDEWFKERYEPETRAPLKEHLNENRRGCFEKWAADLHNGIFDDFTLEGIYKSESNGAGGVVEKEEGEAATANEVLGVSDLLPTRGGDLRDDTINQPTLLIKTIAPTVSREKLEAFCKEHLGEGEGGFRWLSLSDPNPQKKYHRIGWVVLNPASEVMQVDERSDPRDGNTMEEGEDGADPDNDAEKAASTAAKALESINGKTIHDEARGDFTCHVGVHEPPNIGRKKALWDLFSAPERVQRDLSFATRLAQKLDLELGEGYDAVAKINDRVEELRSKGWLQPPVNATPNVKKASPEDDEGMEDEEGAVDEEEGAVDEENDDESLLVEKKQLDLLVEYLRRVYSFCIFCVFESDSVHELTRKCPGGHLRRPRASLTTSAKTAARASANGEAFPFKKNAAPEEKGEEPGSPEQPRKFKGLTRTQIQLEKAYKWVKTYEEKLLQILDPESVDITKLGGKRPEVALEDELKQFMTQEDENKFRCKVPDCTKLFKGAGFWRKHVEKRHEEFFNKIKHEVYLINAYVLDPSHIAPSRSDATSNGHFPMKDHQGMTGTPRGFNYQQHAGSVMGMPSFPGANGGYGQNQNFMQMASMMAAAGGNPMFAGGMPGIPGGFGNSMGGAMRRGRMNDNRMGNPYDRQGGRDNRNQRWQGNGAGGGGPAGAGVAGSMGRLSPPMRGGMMVGSLNGAMMGAGSFARPQGPPRFGEGPAGPQEAVAGRQLRSYQDLDAAGDAGTGDLDY